MRACYCWAVFRNKGKLKSLAVRRHPELREWWWCWGGGLLAEDDGGGGGEGMKGRNSCHSPLVFSRFLKRQLSGLCERSEQREGKPKRAAGGREPHSWEDASPYEQTRDAWPRRATGCSARLQGVPPLCTRPASLLFFFFPFFSPLSPEAGLKFNAGHCASLRNPEWCRCCKPT